MIPDDGDGRALEWIWFGDHCDDSKKFLARTQEASLFFFNMDEPANVSLHFFLSIYLICLLN